MEYEKGREFMGDVKREAFVYSLDIIRVALQSGWKLKLFQRDYGLVYLKNILHDNGIDPSAFFNYDEYRYRDSVNSAYNWAREVQRIALDLFEGDEKAYLEGCLGILDDAYANGEEPWEKLSKEQLVDTSTMCQQLIETVYDLA